jgi:predicted transposase YdaD
MPSSALLPPHCPAYETAPCAGRLYGAPFTLVDVKLIPDEEIMHHRSMTALTLLQQHIHRRDLAGQLDRL